MLRHFVLLSLFLPSIGFAMVKVTGVGGASKFSVNSGSVPKIIGGRGGSGTFAACNSGDNLNTCDGCALADGPMVCNRKRIYPTLRLRITFISDTGTGRPFIGKPGIAAPIELETGSVTKGNAATIDLSWSTICAQLENGSPNCDLTNGFEANGELVVGIDANHDGMFSSGDDSAVVSFKVLDPDPLATGDMAQIDDCVSNATLASPKSGLCGFTAFPGNKKAYAEELEAGSGFPTTNTGTIKYIHFYYQPTDFTTFSPATSRFKSAEIEETNDAYELVDKIVGGLANGTPYYLRTSSVDEAGNEMYFTSDVAIMNSCGSLSPAPPFDGNGAGDFCPFAVVPSKR